MSSVELSFDAVNQTVTLSMPAGATLLSEELEAALQEHGFDRFFRHEAVIKPLLGVVREKPLSVVIAERRNAEYDVTVSADRMSASLTLIAPYGGVYGNVNTALSTLATKGIKFGIVNEAIVDLLHAAESDINGARRSADVAFGSPPVHGVDSQFEMLVTPFNRRLIKPREKEDGSIDYHDLGEVPTIHENEAVMRRHPATPGEMGRNVLGQLLMPTAGKTFEFEKHAGTDISPSDPNTLIATTHGVAMEFPRGVAIENVYRVDQVDLTSGNIAFDGSIVIKGDVARNMAVNCTGYVVINGFVDCASITSGQDMQIAKGLSGGSTMQVGEARAKAQSGKSITVSFAQCAALEAKESIIVDKLLMHCKTHSQTFVRVGGESGGNSNCIGGQVEAHDYMKFDTLGADGGTHTTVILHGHFKELHDKLKQCQLEIKGKNAVMADLETVREKHKLKNLKGDDEMSRRIASTLETAKNEMGSLLRLQKQLEMQLQEQFDQARIIITRHAYPGVDITIADKSVKLNKIFDAGSFVYTLNGLQFKPGETKIPKKK